MARTAKVIELSSSRMNRNKSNTLANTRTLRSRVYDFVIKQNRSLTQLEAWGLFGCGDLRTVMRDLRRQLKKEKSPYKIVTVTNRDVRGRVYGRYYRKRVAEA